MRLRLKKDLLKNISEYVNKEVVLEGWVRNNRNQSNFGFIDFNENAAQCAVRELFEETGVKISEKKVTFYRLATKPGGARQTMNASHYAFFDKEETLNWVFTSEFSENGEIVCFLKK